MSIERIESEQQGDVPKVARPISGSTRLIICVAGVGMIALLIVARCLQPDASGIGTHKQLGLPECGFYTVFGVPCPSCGMTTSWSWATRGNLVRSFNSNAGGFALALQTLTTAVWFLACGYHKRWVWKKPSMFFMCGWMGVPILAALLQWWFRVFI